MSAHKLTDYNYLIFDVYATLIDWETGFYNALKPLLSRFPSTSDWSRREALQAFMSVETDLLGQHPSMLYSDLLAKAHEVFEARLAAAEGRSPYTSNIEGNQASIVTSEGISTSMSADITNEHIAFGNSIKHWAPFPDSAQALRDLAAHFKLIVLSNVDHASFAYTHTYLSEGTSPLDTDDQPSSPTYTRPSPNPHPRDLWLPQRTPDSKSPFSLIMTAQDTHVYKPALDGFLTVFDAIRTEPSLHTSASGGGMLTVDEIKSKTLVVAQSLTHDHEPARQLGVRSVWIDRQGAALRPAGPDGGKDAGWTWRFETLADMARALEEELRGSS